MNRLAVLALVGAGVAWGAGFPLGKRAMQELGAGQLVMLRFLVAALAALPFALATKEARALFRSPALLAGGVLYGLAFQIQFEGLARTSVTLAALLVGAFPALLAVGARLLGEHIPRLSWAGVAAASVGAALIAGKPSAAGGSPLGVALALGSLVVFIAWLFLLRLAPKTRSPMAAPAATVIVAAATMTPVALLLHGPPPVMALSAAAWGAILAQGLVCTLFATAAWQYGLARVGSATAGVFVNLEPLVGSLLGVSFFGDRLSAGLVAGGLLILAGSYATVLGESKQPRTDLAHNPATPA